jgi:hypothetical protein
MSKAKAAALANMDPNAPISELPDCLVKWEKILAKAKADPDYKYIDDAWNICENPEKVLGKKLFDVKD